MEETEKNSRTLVGSLEKSLGFEDGELLAASTAFACFFFIIASYYVLKPIRESLALELGSGRIPALNIFSMFSLVFANGAYSWIVAKFDRRQFIPGITRLFIVCLVGFWIIFGQSVATPEAPGHQVSAGRIAAIGTYFVWVNLFALFSVSMFWSFMNDVFSRLQGQRLYGWIGAGGLVGGFVGSEATSSLVSHFGTANMFLVAALLLEPSVWCMKIVDRLMAQKTQPPALEREPSVPVEKNTTAIHALEGVRRTVSSPFLLLMALEVFLYTFGSNLFSYQVNTLMEKEILSRDLRTQYWAQIYRSINALSIVSQVVVTAIIMRIANPWIGLLLVPASQIVGSVILFQSPSLALAANIGIIRYALNYSTGRVVRELFFTPLSREEKYQAKGFIDTLVFRAGDGISSALLLSWLAFFSATVWIDLALLVTMACQLLVVVKLGQNFNALIEKEKREKVAVPAV